MKTTILTLAIISTLLQANTEPVAPTTKSQPVKRHSVAAKSLVTLTANTSWIDQKIEEIKPKREGLNNSSLATLKSPFIVIKKEQKNGDGKKTATSPKVDPSVTSSKSLLLTRKDMSKEPLTLQIVLNTSALINGKWLKENDTFRGYKLAQIQSNHVVLERKNKKIKLFIAQKSNNINISTK